MNNSSKYANSRYFMDEADSQHMMEKDYSLKIELLNGLYASDSHVKIHWEEARRMHFGMVQIKLNNAAWLKPIHFIHDLDKEKIYLVTNDYYEHEFYSDELSEKLNRVAKSIVAKAVDEIEKQEGLK